MGTEALGFGMSLLAALAAAPTLAQEAPEADREREAAKSAAQPAGPITVYPAAYFADVRPANALDMINRLPGFTFKKGEEVRGFGGAGNVLIDGERPSSKSVALDQILQRIAVNTVERIEVVRSGAQGYDLRGEPMVANVVRTKGARVTRAAQVLVKPYAVGYVGVLPRVEAGWAQGPYALDGSLGGRKDLNTDSGEGSLVRRLGNGGLEAGRFTSEVEANFVIGTLAGQYSRNGEVARFNLGFTREDVDRVENADLRGAAGAFRERTHSMAREDGAEIGGDYRRPLTDRVSVQLIALHTYEQEKLKSRAFNRGPDTASQERSKLTESILRGVVTIEAPLGVTVEGGGEAARNTLESQSALTRGGSVVAIPQANVTVQEERAEVFANARGKTGWGLAVDARMAFETSTIGQEGAASQSRTLSFFKPSLNLAYDVDAATQARFRIARTVGQLSFDDFAAASELEAGTVNAGNPNIVPERAWEYEAALERRFWGAAAVVVTATHAEIEEVSDLIPVLGQFDAPGNIGAGKRDELKVSLSLPLQRLGLAGGLAVFNGTWRWSEVADPVTGELRRISGQRPFEGTLVVTKTLPSLRSTLGLDVGLGFQERYYRINEIRTVEEEPLIKLYWDWVPSPELAFRFQAENITGRERTRYRTLYAGPRSLGVLAFDEARNARLAPFLMVRARRTF